MPRTSPSAPTVAELCSPSAPPVPPTASLLPAGSGGASGPTMPFIRTAKPGEDGVEEIQDLEQMNSPPPTSSISSPGIGSCSSPSTRFVTGAGGSRTGVGSSSRRARGGRVSSGDDKDATDGKPASCCQRCSDCCFQCTARCTRVLLVVPNVIFLIFGATLVGLGVWMRADPQSVFYIEILRNVPAAPVAAIDQLPVAIIAVGSCVTVLSFLGCCGACFESSCFLCLYAFLLVLSVLAEVTIGIVIAVMRDQLLLTLGDALRQQIRNDYNWTMPSTDAVPSRSHQQQNMPTTTVQPAVADASYGYHLTTAWDTMHNQFQCCGADGPQDFVNSAWYNRTSRYGQFKLPPSCCYSSSGGTQGTNEPVTDSNGRALTAASMVRTCQSYFEQYLVQLKNPLASIDARGHWFLKTQGCKQSLLDQVRENLLVLIGVVCAVVLLQIVDFGFACLLMTWFRKKQAECSWYDDDEFFD